jgi:hypothetical protein
MGLASSFRNFLLRHRYYTAHATQADRLVSFFSRVRPVAIRKPLIRVGGNGDGGYLIPDDLASIDACFSPGVSTISNFEAALAECGIPCYMADYSVDGPAIAHPLFHFEKKFLGVRNDDVFMRLEDWVAREAPENSDNLLLQMDIEGAEYPVFIDTPDTMLKRFRMIVVEFHMLGALFDNAGFLLVDTVLQKLLHNFAIVHIHPNNCCPVHDNGVYAVPSVMELTFYRRDCVSAGDQLLHFPHPLDAPNISHEPDLILPECWR